MIYTGGTSQSGLGTYFPPFTNYRFGSPLIANYGGTNSVIGGSFLPHQNAAFASMNPIPFDLPSFFPIGDMNLGPNILPNAPGDPVAPVETPAPVDGENRVIHYIKLQFIGLVALVLLAVGLYLLSQQTDTGKAIKEKAVQAAKTAGEAALVA